MGIWSTKRTVNFKSRERNSKLSSVSLQVNFGKKKEYVNKMFFKS